MNTDVMKFTESQNELNLLFERSYALAKIPVVGKSGISKPWDTKLYDAVNTATYVLPVSIFAAMAATEQSMPTLYTALVVTNIAVLSLTAINLACQLPRGRSLLYMVRKKFGKRQNGMNKIERMERDYNLKMGKHQKLVERTQKQREKLTRGTSKMIDKLNSTNLRYSFYFGYYEGLVIEEREDTAPLFKVLEVMNKAHNKEVASAEVAS